MREIGTMWQIPDLPFLAFWISLLLSLQGIALLFERFSLLSQGF